MKKVYFKQTVDNFIHDIALLILLFIFIFSKVFLMKMKNIKEEIMGKKNLLDTFLLIFVNYF